MNKQDVTKCKQHGQLYQMIFYMKIYKYIIYTMCYVNVFVAGPV